MNNSIRMSGITLFFILVLTSFVLCEEEEFVITTYYPSPYGSYNELYVYSKLGVGTTAPSESLEVKGNIKLSGISPSYKITNVALPTAANDVANKAYVDAASGSSFCVTTQASYVLYSGYTCSGVFTCPSGYTVTCGKSYVSAMAYNSTGWITTMQYSYVCDCCCYK